MYCDVIIISMSTSRDTGVLCACTWTIVDEIIVHNKNATLASERFEGNWTVAWYGVLGLTSKAQGGDYGIL
jgi:hypothetical protein